MQQAFRIDYYVGKRPQRLSNVTLVSPSLLWVTTGSKRLFWKEDTLDLNASKLLLLSGRTRLTFENLPEQYRFQSCQISLFEPPDEQQLRYSQHTQPSSGPWITLTPPLVQTLELLKTLKLSALSLQVQSYWLKALYQQLAEQGVLHWLFPESHSSTSQALAEYFSIAPGQPHSLLDACQHFGLSRATLLRRLHQENTRFRDILSDVRMSYAIYLMQQGERKLIDLALHCGYQSPQRFSQRFEKQFGVSVSRYMATLPN